MANFAAFAPAQSPDARDVPRLTMTQPNCYWTLTSTLVTIVGLYSNVPENGYIDSEQAAWFARELSAAPTDRPLIVTSHHPGAVLDRYHGGSAPMLAGHRRRGRRGRSGSGPGGRRARSRLPALGTGNERGHRAVPGGRCRRVLAPVRGAGPEPATRRPALPGARGRRELCRTWTTGTATCGSPLLPSGLDLEYVTVPRSQESWHTPGAVYETYTIPTHRQRDDPEVHPAGPRSKTGRA